MSEDYYSHRHSSGRGSIGAVDDSGDVQTVDIEMLKGEKFTKVMRIQPHGFSSVPIVDSHGHVISPGGSRDRLYYFGGEHKDKRPKNLPAGTAVLYDDQGNVIRAYGSDGIQLAATKGQITVKPEKGKNVYLGGDGKDGTYAPVMTTQGPSSNVFAKV